MGWTLVRIWTVLVYTFMFLPVAVVVLLSFNASQFGSFPMTGLSFRWFVELAQNEAILRAFRTSIVLGLLTAVISTTLGVLASLALVRYKVPGSNLISTLLIAPILVPFSALLGLAVIPMGNGIHLADPETGVAFMFAAASIASLGLLTAGYASNNKYAFLGGLRAVAQNIAYEIPLVVTAASVVIFAGSLQMSEIVAAQTATLVSLGPVSIPAWYAFVNPFAFVLFVAANLAEVGRNPFDVPEAPTEIVAGVTGTATHIAFQTYSKHDLEAAFSLGLE